VPEKGENPGERLQSGSRGQRIWSVGTGRVKKSKKRDVRKQFSRLPKFAFHMQAEAKRQINTFICWQRVTNLALGNSELQTKADGEYVGQLKPKANTKSVCICVFEWGPHTTAVPATCCRQGAIVKLYLSDLLQSSLPGDTHT